MAKFFTKLIVPKLILICSLFEHLLFNYAPFVKLNSITVEASMTESKELMNGKVLRILFCHYPPGMIMIEGPNETFAYSGTQQMILDYFARALNISYEYIHVSEEEIKKLGLGPAMFASVATGEADLAPFGFVPSHEKFVKCDLSVPTMIEPWRFIVPWPKEESRLLAPIRPFQPAVWCCLGISLLVLAPVITCLSGLYKKYVNKMENRNQRPTVMNFGALGRSSLFLWSHLTNHGCHINNLKSLASYIIIGMWLLVTVVLANAYAGTLFSFLSVAKLEPIVNSFEALAKSNEVQIIVQARTELALHYLNAKSGPEKIIGDSLRAHPDNMISTIAQVKQKIINGPYAFPYLYLYTRGIVHDTFEANNRKCRMTYSTFSASLFAPIVLMLNKNGPYTTAINEQIQAQFEAGLIDFYMKKYMPRVDQCLMENQKDSAGQKPLTLRDMSSAFVVFGLGISLSILAFLLELIYKRIQQHYYQIN